MGIDRPRRILVIERDRDLGEMFATVLAMAGYQARWLPEQPDALTEILAQQPDLLVVGLGPATDAEPSRFLDLLRANDAVRGIPVLAVTTEAETAERAIASFNVKATLAMPFELDDLLQQTRHALIQPSLHRTLPPGSHPEGMLRLAEEILAARSRDALFRWVQRLRTQTGLRNYGSLRLSEVLDNVPILIEVLTAVFHYESPERLLADKPEVAERIRVHAITRRSQGVPLPLLIQEFAFLRQEIWRAFWRELPEGLDRDEVARLQAVVDGTFDAILQHTVPSYLEGQQSQQ